MKREVLREPVVGEDASGEGTVVQAGVQVGRPDRETIVAGNRGPAVHLDGDGDDSAFNCRVLLDG